MSLYVHRVERPFEGKLMLLPYALQTINTVNWQVGSGQLSLSKCWSLVGVLNTPFWEVGWSSPAHPTTLPCKESYGFVLCITSWDYQFKTLLYLTSKKDTLTR